MALTKSTMYYSDYSWTAVKGDDPRVSGPPDSTKLSRKEGYEVLYFVNRYGEKNGLSTQQSLQKVERMVRKAPADTTSQVGVYNWIQTNWSNHA